MLNILSALCFAGFLVLALAVGWAERAGPRVRRRHVVNAFLGYTVIATFGAGFAQRDAWPFASWPLAAAPGPYRARLLSIAAVDGLGEDHEVDYRAWQPMELDGLLSWITFQFWSLDDAAKRRAARYLVERAETSRRRAAAGGGVGYFDRVFGVLTAPYFTLYPRLWLGPGTIPQQPFVGLRVYEETWTLDRAPRDGRAVVRRVVYEYAP